MGHVHLIILMRKICAEVIHWDSTQVFIHQFILLYCYPLKTPMFAWGEPLSSIGSTADSLADGGKTYEQLGLCIAPGLLLWDGLSSCFRQHTLYFRSNTEGREAGEPNRWSLTDTLNILHSSKGSLNLHACISRRRGPSVVHAVCSSTSLYVFIYL